MRFRTTLLITLLSAPLFLFAQKVKFGKIDESDLAMKSWSSDPAAPGLILFDKVFINNRYSSVNGFVSEYTRHLRIKIFSKEAVHYADYPILYGGSTDISDLKAASYNLENGKMVTSETEKEHIFDEKLTKSYSIRRITIPNVREGSIFEIKYTLTDKDGIGLSDWTFQDEELPTLLSEFEASVPSFVEFKKMARGWVPFALSKEDIESETLLTKDGARVDYTCNTLHFIQENIPALKMEPLAGSSRDYLSQIRFDIRAVYNTEIISSGGGAYRLQNTGYRERNNSWERLGKDIQEDLLDNYFKDGKDTRDIAQSTVQNAATLEEKYTALYEYVGRNYTLRKDSRFIISQSLNDLIKKRIGAPSELNLLYIHLLRQAGIKAYPLLISTQKNGTILPFSVSFDAFDRFLTAVETTDSTVQVIDAAAWPNPPGLLPENDLNGDGLLLHSPDKVIWIPVYNTFITKKTSLGNFNIQPNGQITGVYSFLNNGYHAVESRLLVQQKKEQGFVSEFFKNLVDEGEVSDIVVETPEKWQEQAIKGSFNLQTEAFSSSSGNRIYLSPALDLSKMEHPFKNPERKFHVNFNHPQSQNLNYTFKIPAGYKVETMPKATKLSFGENDILFQYMISSNAEELKVNIRFNIQQPLILNEQYADLQQFYQNMLSKLAEQAVLVKI
jgi:hypothetical protein